MIWISLFPLFKYWAQLEALRPAASVTEMSNIIDHKQLDLRSIVSFIVGSLREVAFAFSIILLFSLGLLVAYNISVLFNWILMRFGLKAIPQLATGPHTPPAGTPASNPLQEVKKIGIVLAGGGAKGAFQAGAMKAIYKFLADNDALPRVAVISGTSIGSWNALFWLGNLIQSEKGWEEHSPHETWWRGISLRSLVAPSWYVPCFRNAFFVTAPWQLLF